MPWPPPPFRPLLGFSHGPSVKNQIRTRCSSPSLRQTSNAIVDSDSLNHIQLNGYGRQAWAVKWANPKTLRKCPTRIQLTDFEVPHPVGADFDAKPGPLNDSQNSRKMPDPNPTRSVFRFLFRVRILSVDRADMYCHRVPG